MSSRASNSLWVVGCIMAVATITFFVWQFERATMFTGLTLVVVGAWFTYGAALSVGYKRFKLACALMALSLIPVLSIFAIGMVVGFADHSDNVVGGAGFTLVIVMLAVFVWMMDTEIKERKHAEADRGIVPGRGSRMQG